MFAPGVEGVLVEFHSTSITLASFVVSIYVLGYCIGPLFVAPLSEMYGRAPVYHVSNVLYLIFTVACAVSSSLPMLIVFRFFAGAVGSTPISIGGGTFGDLFRVEERGAAISIWAMGPLLGPVVGPVAGGFLAEAAGWRWIFWLITIAVGLYAILIAATERLANQLLGGNIDCHNVCVSPGDLRNHAAQPKSQTSTKGDRESQSQVGSGPRSYTEGTI
jgi:multidrug resistance protein